MISNLECKFLKHIYFHSHSQDIWLIKQGDRKQQQQKYFPGDSVGKQTNRTKLLYSKPGTQNNVSESPKPNYSG